MPSQKKRLSFKDYKNGNLTQEERAEFEAQLKIVVKAMQAQIKGALKELGLAETEAKQLFDVINNYGIPDAISYLKEHPPSAYVIYCLFTLVRKELITERASEGGKGKSKIRDKAKAFIRSEWEDKKKRYKENKADFARDYEGILVKEFGPDEAVNARTIETRWLPKGDHRTKKSS